MVVPEEDVLDAEDGEVDDVVEEPGIAQPELALRSLGVQHHRLSRPVPGLQLDEAAVVGGEAVEQVEADLEGLRIFREPPPQRNVEKEFPLSSRRRLPRRRTVSPDPLPQ